MWFNWANVCALDESHGRVPKSHIVSIGDHKL